MKKIKKTIAVLLSFVMALSLFGVCASAEEGGLKISVASDVHTSVVEKISDFYGDGTLANRGTLLSLRDESFAVLDSFLRDSAEAGAKYVFLAGDNTDSGTTAQHEKITAILKDYETRTGVEVFVVPGNHDYSAMGEEGVAYFREAYKDFGYGEAYASDDKTASYAVDLADGYTLIAVDSVLPGDSADGITNALLSWVEAQAKAATERGRKLICMMHHPIIPQFSLQEKFMSDSVVRDWRKVSESLASFGIQYVFTGHKHSADIAQNISTSGNVIYDVGVPSLVIYPLAYRFVTFSDEKVAIREMNVTSIKMPELLPSGYSTETLDKVINNTQEYSEEVFDASFRRFVESSILNPTALCRRLNIEDEKTKEAFKSVCSKAKTLIDYPLYGEGETIETIAAGYNIALPASDYETAFDVLNVVFKAYCNGDENLSVSSTEIQLGLKCFAILADYSLEDYPDDIRILFLNALAACFTGDTPAVTASITAVVLGLGDGDFGVGVASALIKPFLEEILVDEAPADRNVDLPACTTDVVSNKVVGALSFFEKVAAFFLKIWNFICGIFAAFSK